MGAKREKIHFASVEELLGAPTTSEEGTVEIRVDQIYPFENHPFKVRDDDKMEELVESIKNNGVLTPVLVRPDDEGNYEMISGHRRLHAAKRAGLTVIPAIVKLMTNDDAIIAMVDANCQRELDTEKGIGLIEKRKQGQGKAAIIYVKSFMRDAVQEFENQTSREKTGVSEVYISNFKNPKNQTSRSLEIKPLEVYISNPNNNKLNNNNISDNQSNLILSQGEMGRDAMGYARLIRKNLEIDLLSMNDPLEKELYEEIYAGSIVQCTSYNQQLLPGRSKS